MRDDLVCPNGPSRQFQKVQGRSADLQLLRQDESRDLSSFRRMVVPPCAEEGLGSLGIVAIHGAVLVCT